VPVRPGQFLFPFFFPRRLFFPAAGTPARQIVAFSFLTLKDLTFQCGRSSPPLSPPLSLFSLVCPTKKIRPEVCMPLVPFSPLPNFLQEKKIFRTVKRLPFFFPPFIFSGCVLREPVIRRLCVPLEESRVFFFFRRRQRAVGTRPGMTSGEGILRFFCFFFFFFCVSCPPPFPTRGYRPWHENALLLSLLLFSTTRWGSV